MTEPIARLHIALAHTEPLIWRRIDFPVDANLKQLHDAIQGAMGWLDYHLWEFETAERRYGVPDPGWPDDTLVAAKNVKLSTLLDRGISQLLYTYDMGDDWQHVVTVEAVKDGQPGTKYPRYVAGERRAPPEDCGGTPGFEAFLEIIANAEHPEHEEAVEWHLGLYGKAYDPEVIEELEAKLRIGDIAKRRAAGKASRARRAD